MKLKMQNGTRGEKPLCGTCSYAHIRKGSAIGQEMFFCGRFYEHPLRLVYPIVECNDYNDATLPSLHSMKEIALFITVDKRTGKIGFVSSDKADEKMHDEVESPFQV